MDEMIRTEDIHATVTAHYGALAQRTAAPAGDCCGPQLYQVDTSDLPIEVTSVSLGCGDPIALASLEAGQTVLDLGSGGGIDCFLAAQRVGPAGKVIGVDMTPAMLARARANQEKLGLTNVEFREGRIEALPVDDATVDVIISNCVINLSPDKRAVFGEAFRVLKPGGRLAVSDMVTLGRYDAEQRADSDAWCACTSGAENIDDLVAWLHEAGFVGVSIRDKEAPEAELAEQTTALRPLRLLSAHITAYRPVRQVAQQTRASS